MNSDLQQAWNVPITDYWLFYLILGIVAFALCLYNRSLIFAALPILLWCCIADMHSFYYQDVGSNKLGPDGDYIFAVGFSMVIAFSLSAFGAYLNWRKFRR